MDRNPSIGMGVHYVSHGTPARPDGTQAYTSQCRAADITEVDPQDSKHVGLMVKNPTGLIFHSLADGGSDYDAGGETPGDPTCANQGGHGSPFRYCACGWIEASYAGGSWHWPECVE